MRTRNWSIRSKIVALVAVPLTALLALWIFATVLTIGPALDLLSARTVHDRVNGPGEKLVAELQHERRLSVIQSARDADPAPLGQQRTRTDAAAAAFQREATGTPVRDAADDLLLGRINDLVTAMQALPAGRGLIDRRQMDPVGALNLYSGVIDVAFRMFGATGARDDPQLERETRALTALGRAREVLGRADALLAGALGAGRFAAGEHPQFVQFVGVARHLYADAAAELSAADRTTYQRLAESPEFVQLRQMQDRIVTDGRPGEAVPVDAAQWQNAYESAVDRLGRFETATANALAGRARPAAVSILARLGVAAILGLTALLLAIIVSVRVGRSLVRRLGGLRGAALQLTKQRLPEVVARLRRGEDVDVAAEAPALEYGTDEIGQLGHAFTEVQRTAVQSAVDEAIVRRGLNEVFLNIARRSQALLHRQLALLDRMERRAAEPDELEDLFRVDHLATRMRRHAEDLVILAGATPGRGWRHPVPFVDVIRGAVSEVEDYRRIDVGAVADAALAGRAVGDVIHLLAELLENATSFSPPHTRVQVAGQVVPNGFAVEIEDRGLGMPADALDDANRRLAEPPDFDPTNSARLGLFVVSQLGVRHGVRVRLRPSPYGGVTAVALIPKGLVVPVAHVGPAQLPARPSDGSPADLALPDLPASSGTGASGTAASGTAASGTAASGTAAAYGAVEPFDMGAPAAGTAQPGRLPRRIPALLSPRELDSSPEAPSPPETLSRPETLSPPVPAADRPRTDIPIGEDGLPRRIRQTHLTPWLREPAPTDPPSPAAAGAAERTPQQVRAMMSSLQAGTARGRLAATTPDGGPAGAAPDGVPAGAAPDGGPASAAPDGGPAGAPEHPGTDRPDGPGPAWQPDRRVPSTGIVVGYRTAGDDAANGQRPSSWFALPAVEPSWGAARAGSAGQVTSAATVDRGEIIVRSPAEPLPAAGNSGPPGPDTTPTAHPGTGDGSDPQGDA